MKRINCKEVQNETFLDFVRKWKILHDLRSHERSIFGTNFSLLAQDSFIFSPNFHLTFFARNIQPKILHLEGGNLVSKVRLLEFLMNFDKFS